MEQSLPEVRTVDELEGLIEKHRSFLAVLFYTDSSRKSTQAAHLLTEIKKDKLDTAVAAVNASRTRDIHPRFGVTTVPTLLTFKQGRPAKRFEGLLSVDVYRAVLADAPRRRADGSEAPPLRVTVYSSPTCPPCGVVKSYLRKKGVRFRVIDVSRDEQAAQEIMNRTGSAAVPQIDINGTVIIGADMGRIDELIAMR